MLTVDYDEPIYGPPPIFLTFDFFESAVNGWLTFDTPAMTMLAHSSATLLPGVAQFNVSLDADNLADVYFKARGLYDVYLPPKDLAHT